MGELVEEVEVGGTPDSMRLSETGHTPDRASPQHFNSSADSSFLGIA